MELHAVAGTEQQRVVAERCVPPADVVDRQRPPEQLVAARRLDRDRSRRTGPPIPTAPSAVHVRVGLYFGTKTVSRGSSGNMNGRPGKKPMKAVHCSRREDRLVELLAVGEAVVADDVVDVRAALGVRRVLADRVGCSARTASRDSESSNASGMCTSRLGIVTALLGLERIVHAVEVLDERGRRQYRRVVHDEDRAEAGRRLDHALRAGRAKRVVHGEHEEVERQVELHRAVLDEHAPVARVPVGDRRLAVLGGALHDHGRAGRSHATILTRCRRPQLGERSELDAGLLEPRADRAGDRRRVGSVAVHTDALDL